MEVALPMQNSIPTLCAIFGSAAMAWLVAMPIEARAQPDWINNSEAAWIRFDLEAERFWVNVRKLGRGPNVRRLRKDRPATFKFDVGGAGSGKTIVMIDDEKGGIADIPENAVVQIHWRPIENDRYGMFATKIVYSSDEEPETPKEPAE
jgi:hypothetical protein